MASISKIQMPSGTTYDIKDAEARRILETLAGGSAVVFIGVSTTELTDGGSEIPTISGQQKTPAAGQLFFYGTNEFIWGNDNKWHALGSLSALGTLAYQDSAYGSYTPAGTVSAPTIGVKTAGATTTISNPTAVTVAKTVVAAAPDATAPDNAITYYSVANETLSLYQIGYTTGNSITTDSVTVKTGDAEYQAGTPTFNGTAATITVS